MKAALLKKKISYQLLEHTYLNFMQGKRGFLHNRYCFIHQPVEGPKSKHKYESFLWKSSVCIYSPIFVCLRRFNSYNADFYVHCSRLSISSIKMYRKHINYDAVLRYLLCVLIQIVALTVW